MNRPIIIQQAEAERQQHEAERAEAETRAREALTEVMVRVCAELLSRSREYRDGQAGVVS